MIKEHVTQLATDVAMPSGGVIATGVAAFGAAVAAVWTWFRGELDDCKKDRKELYNRVDKLHEDVSSLSLRVGQVERPKS